MSEELKKRLFNHEVSPPESAWTKIASALEEEVSAEFPHKLYKAEVAPPSDAWKNIMSSLEPVEKEAFAAKLHAMEVPPPVDTWQKISGALHNEDSIRTIPPRKKITPIIRYAVAASLVAVVAFGVVRLLNQKAKDGGIAGKTVAPQKTSPATIQPGSEQTPPVQSVPVLSNNLPKEPVVLGKAKTVLKKKLNASQASYMTQTAEMTYALNSNSASDFQQASLRQDVPGNCPLIVDADRYLNFMNPDGSLVRVSKKLADAVGCFYNNGTSDEYRQCQEQMKRWRDKLSQSSSTPSADNFMDVLDIIKSAQDREL